MGSLGTVPADRPAADRAGVPAMVPRRARRPRAPAPPGGALLVANHAGALPVDAALLMHGIETATGRPVYGLHHWMLRETPFVGTFLARNGGVVANPANAQRLLADEGQLVLVFPEGTKGTTKPYSQRYRLQRFGRGGFIEVAMRAGVPVLPVAVTGTEETMPALFSIDAGRGVRIPVTANAVAVRPCRRVRPVAGEDQRPRPAARRSRRAGRAGHLRPPHRRRVGRAGARPAPGRARPPRRTARASRGGVTMRRVLVTGASTPLGRLVDGTPARARVDVARCRARDRPRGRCTS